MRSVGARSSVVATAIGARPARRRPNSAAEVGQRHAPWRPGPGRTRPPRPPRRAAATLGHQRRTTARDQLADLGHRGDRQRASPGGRARWTGRSRSSRTRRRPPAGAWRRRAAGRAPTAQPPHIAWNSMSVPSLSKTTRSIPSRRAGHTSASSSAAAARALARRAQDEAGLRREPDGDRVADRRQRQVRLVERVERDRRRRPRPSAAPSPRRSRMRTIEPRKLMSSTVPRSRFAPVGPVAERDALGPERRG